MGGGGGGLLLFVRSAVTETVPVEVSVDATGADVEAAVLEYLQRSGAAPPRWSLSFQGKALQRDAALADLGVCQQSCLQLSCGQFRFAESGPRVVLSDDGRTATNSNYDTAGDYNQYALGDVLPYGVHTWRIVGAGTYFIGVGRAGHPLGYGCGGWGPDAWFLSVCHHCVFNDPAADARIEDADVCMEDGPWTAGTMNPGDAVAVRLVSKPEGAQMRLAMNGVLAPVDPCSREMTSADGFVPLVGFMDYSTTSVTISAATPEDLAVFEQRRAASALGGDHPK